VDAYLLESKVAKYPRIILDRQIIDLIEKEKNRKGHRRLLNKTRDYLFDLYFLKDIITADTDEHYYLDYFSIHSDDPPILDELAWLYLEFLSDKICEGLNLAEEPGNEYLLAKYDWMRDKYNQKAEYYNSEEFYNKYYRDNPEFKDYGPEYEKVGIIYREKEK